MSFTEVQYNDDLLYNKITYMVIVRWKVYGDNYRTVSLIIHSMMSILLVKLFSFSKQKKSYSVNANTK